VADIEQGVADYWRSVQLPKDRIQALKDMILADLEGRHAKVSKKSPVSVSVSPGSTMSEPRPRSLTTMTLSRLTSSSSNKSASAAKNAAAQAAIAQWTIEIDAMRRSLDEALSLLTDPYRLYTEAPRASTSCSFRPSATRSGSLTPELLALS
jgi:hypothetical protein